jgi:molecular chaperone GrpE (heat shock protein)
MEETDAADNMQCAVQRIYPLSGEPVDPVLHTVIGEDQPGGEHSLARGSVLVCDEAGYQVLMSDHPQGNFVLRKATVIVVA